MTERDKIFARIREALQAGGGEPGPHARPVATAQRAGEPRSWLPRVDAAPEAQLETFVRNAVDLKATFHRVAGVQGAVALLNRLAAEEGWKQVASHRGQLPDRVTGSLSVPVLFTDNGYDPAALEQCEAGITACDALVAQTGSVLLTSTSAGGRALSALPPHHIVLATPDQLVPDLPEAFVVLRQKYEGRFPSFISFVTGPSRTGDIERILVLGAHGPKKLTILWIDP